MESRDEERIEAILGHWFGELEEEWAVPKDRTSIWFGRSDEIDEDLRSRFAADVERAKAGALDHWRATPRGALALVILFDQLPRNLYRGTAGMYETDQQALSLALELIESGADRGLRPIERVFVYLPLEHSEELPIQRRCVGLFRSLAEAAPAQAREPFEQFLDYAIRHEVIIARFGRFPHRNAILGRASTPEEEAFLLEPGSSF